MENNFHSAICLERNVWWVMLKEVFLYFAEGRISLRYSVTFYLLFVENCWVMYSILKGNIRNKDLTNREITYSALGMLEG